MQLSISCYWHLNLWLICKYQEPARNNQVTTMPSVPDAEIYPEASGPAKALVDRHQAEQPLKLHAGWFCS